MQVASEANSELYTYDNEVARNAREMQKQSSCIVRGEEAMIRWRRLVWDVLNWNQ